jgi:hypothetical protein
LLATGSHCLVADDWQSLQDSTWETFDGSPGFVRPPLVDVVRRLGAPAQSH